MQDAEMEKELLLIKELKKRNKELLEEMRKAQTRLEEAIFKDMKKETNQKE